MTKVYGLLVAKNEEHRYLEEFIDYHKNIFDNMFLFDDHSTDGTVDLANRKGVCVRSAEEETFMAHEGQFRYAAWLAFEEAMRPTEEDWVFAIDADEFLVGKNGDVKETLHSTIDLAEYMGYGVVHMKVDEIWDMDGQSCYARKDGLWDKIKASRLFKYQPNGKWNMKAMGCGSGPTYTKAQSFKTQNINIMHFGYAKAEDRQAKFDRYVNLPNHGHNPSHVMSIVRPPILRKYEGQIPAWVTNG